MEGERKRLATPRRLGNQQLDVEMEIRNRAKISFEHLAIAG